MAFLRRKRHESPTKGLSEKPVIGSPQAQVSQSTATPLYSRFASSAASSSQTRLVSGPMSLQQRQPPSDRSKYDDPRRKPNAQSNPNLRAIPVHPNPTQIPAAKLDKPLPPPGPASPDLGASPVSAKGRSPALQAQPQADLRIPPQVRSMSPPTSFAQVDGSSKEKDARKSTFSLMSDLPEHMYNIHNLDFDNLADFDASKDSRSATPPRQQTSRIPSGATKSSQPAPAQQPSRRNQYPVNDPASKEPDTSRSVPRRDLSPSKPPPPSALKRISRQLPSPVGSPDSSGGGAQSASTTQISGPRDPTPQGRNARGGSSLPQPSHSTQIASQPTSRGSSNPIGPTPNGRPQPVPPSNNPNTHVSPNSQQPPPSQADTNPALHRSTSRAVPHAALMQSSSSVLSRTTSQHQSSSPPPTSKPNRRQTFTPSDSPYSLANPVSSITPRSKPDPGTGGSGKRVIDLNDPAPIAPSNVRSPGGVSRRPSTADEAGIPVRRGPLIFAAGGGLGANEEMDSGKANGHHSPSDHLTRPQTADNAVHVSPPPAGAQAPQPQLHRLPSQQHPPHRVLHHPHNPIQPPQEPPQSRVPHRLSKAPHNLIRKTSNASPLYPTSVQSVSDQPLQSPGPPSRPQQNGHRSKASILSNLTSKSDSPTRLGTGDSAASSSSFGQQPQPRQQSPELRKRKDSTTENRTRKDSANKKWEPLTPPQDGGDEEKHKRSHRLVKQRSGSLRPGTADRLQPSPVGLGFGDLIGGNGNGWDGQGEVSKVDQETIRKAGLPLDDDPFASGGVTVLQPPPPMTLGNEENEGPTMPKDKLGNGATAFGFSAGNAATPSTPPHPVAPLSPVTPPHIREHRTRADVTPPRPPPTIVDVPLAYDRDPAPFPLPYFLTVSPAVLKSLLVCLSFYDFCCISVVTKKVKNQLEEEEELREVVLERFLGVVGYEKWAWGKGEQDASGAVNGAIRKGMGPAESDKEPLTLTLKDLMDYMRGISMPVHEYARTAAQHIHQIRSVSREQRDAEIGYRITKFAASTRAYTKVVLRLRAQAERAQKDKDKERTETLQRQRRRESSNHSQQPSSPPNSYYNAKQTPPRAPSRNSSRAPSPTLSMFSHSHHGHGGGHQNFSPPRPPPLSQSHSTSLVSQSKSSTVFNSPLFRLHRAPLLRVFVPSPEGTWLSDASVLECEAELRRAGVVGLLRPGDVVWDVAVGDEANIGRLIWDGSYLIDLDYTYSNVGDLPKYMPGLAFPPSYFHKVIRTRSSSSNPIIHVDISPWGEQIAGNLQLIQDRVRTETPQGAYHNVVRWVHRSSFVIQPPAIPKQPSFSSYYYNDPRKPQRPVEQPRITIPGHQGMFVDPGWYGTIVVETEGTNEALADLQARCGPGAFPPRANGVNHNNPNLAEKEREQRKVFRILRERSRPGEIWIRAVTMKERIL